MWRNRWNRANCKKWVYLATEIVAAPPLSSCSTKELNGSLFQLADKLERPSTAARIETNVTRQVCSQVSSLFAVVWSAAYRIAHSGALYVQFLCRRVFLRIRKVSTKAPALNFYSLQNTVFICSGETWSAQLGPLTGLAGWRGERCAIKTLFFTAARRGH